MRRKGRFETELPRSVAAVVSESLEREIVEGRLLPGERLVEADWAGQFGISRGSFREVLRTLANAKLVEIIPRRGARVAVLNRRDLEEVYFLRRHLLSIGFERAAHLLGHDDCQELEKIVERMASALKRSDPNSFCRLSLAFDDAILTRTDQTRLAEIMNLLGKPTIRYRFIGARLPGRMAASLAHHQRIVQAFRERDGRVAAREVFASVKETGAAIIDHLFADTSAEAPSGRAG